MNDELTFEERLLLKRLATPKYTFADIEKYMLDRGINPFAPWMKEDHIRCRKILMRKKLRVIK